MEEPAIHAAAVKQPHSAGVAIGQNGFRAELAGYREQAFGNGVQRIVPRDALEASRALGAYAALGREQPLGVILAFQILRHFAAEESARHGMVRIAAQSGGMVVLNCDQKRAAVRAIQGTHRMSDFSHFQRLYRGWLDGLAGLARGPPYLASEESATFHPYRFRGRRFTGDPAGSSSTALRLLDRSVSEAVVCLSEVT